MEEGEVGRPRKHSTEQKSSSMSSSEIHVGKVHYELKSIRNEKAEEGKKGKRKSRGQHELDLCPALSSFTSDGKTSKNVLC